MEVWQIVLLGVIGITFFDLLLFWLIARFGPWRRLVEVFPFDETVRGQKYWFQSLGTRWPTSLGAVKFNYGGVLIAECAPDAITLRCWMAFHEPLTIHREDVNWVEFDNYWLPRFLGIHTVTIRIDGWELVFSGKVAKAPFWKTIPHDRGETEREEADVAQS